MLSTLCENLQRELTACNERILLTSTHRKFSMELLALGE